MRFKPLDERAAALQVVRAKNDNIRLYTPICCDLQAIIQRCRRDGYLYDDLFSDSFFMLNVLDAAGNIIQDYSLSSAGFEGLRRWLKFKWEREVEA